LKSFGSHGQRVRKEQFIDYYLTKSLAIEKDYRFKQDLLDEWLISDSEADYFLG
jgi:hypothetical protein